MNKCTKAKIQIFHTPSLSVNTFQKKLPLKNSHKIVAASYLMNL